MSLKEKAAAAAKALADFNEPVPSADVMMSTPQTLPMRVPAALKARSGVASITETIGIHHRVTELEQRVSEYEKSGVVVELDPALIAPSRFRNRHELSFSTPDFNALRQDIAHAGGNVQPILVRALTGDNAKHPYEVVFGRRRLRSCLELGIKVRAIVDTLSDAEAFQAAERENRDRADLSAWEQGMMYKDGLDHAVYGSIRQMAAALSLNHSHLSKSIRLASLPPEIVEAFISPLDLQFRWAAPLCDAFDKDPQRALSIAAELKARSPRLPSKEVYERLRSGGSPSVGEVAEPDRVFRADGAVVATWAKDKKGNGTLSIRSVAVNPASERKLLSFLDRLWGEK